MSTPSSYDLVPYESHPFPQTHPDRLAVIGTLLGMRPASVERCRVLEIGCAAGGNLIPLALAYPESKFVGIDLSQVQINEGLETIAALGLTNIKLRAESVLDFPSPSPPAGRGSPDPDYAPTAGLHRNQQDRPSPPAPLPQGARGGVFDYIICHGVYSWVPAAVQRKILEICKTCLAPQGIGYVSYNTYPGWHMRGMIRDMLQFHVGQFTTPAQKVRQARNLLDFLGKAVAGAPAGRDTGPPLTPGPGSQRGEGGSAYAVLLRNELESFRRSSDSYLFHEHLEEVNEPIYFHQFVERAAEQGLRYLGEADLRVMVPGNFPPEIENVLQMLAQDAVHLEQYMDFLRNRMFRQTLLCHTNVEANYSLRWEQVRKFQIASPAKAVGERGKGAATDSGPPLTPGPSRQGGEGGSANGPMQFETPDGIILQARDAIVQAALLELAEVWPRSMSFGELLERARGRLAKQDDTRNVSAAVDAETLGRSLLQFYSQASTSLVEFWLSQPRFTATAGERPKTSPLARLQAETKDRVTTLRHETARLGDFERHILRLLDGTRDRPALLTALVALVEQGELTVEKDGQPETKADQVREVVGQALQSQLQALARHALLLA